MSKKRIKIGLIGCGKVGLSFVKVIKGFSIIGVYDRNSRKITKAKKLLRKKKMTPREMIKKADIILIATHDDQIKIVAQRLRKAEFNGVLIHFSGAWNSRILGSKNRASMHPLGSFADLKMAKSWLPKTPFTVEGDKLGVKEAKKLIKSFKGKFQVISARDKPYYHLACVFGSNLLLALISITTRIMEKKNIKLDILPLIESTVENYKLLGIKKGITGPVVRGDINTIRKHVETLKKMGANHRLLYYILNQEMLRLGLSDKKKLLRTELISLFKNSEINT